MGSPMEDDVDCLWSRGWFDDLNSEAESNIRAVKICDRIAKVTIGRNFEVVGGSSGALVLKCFASAAITVVGILKWVIGKSSFI